MENGDWNEFFSTNDTNQNFTNSNEFQNDVSSLDFLFGGNQPSYDPLSQFQPPAFNESGNQLSMNSSTSYGFNQNPHCDGFQNYSPSFLLGSSNQGHPVQLLDRQDFGSMNANLSNQVQVFPLKDVAQDNVRSELQPVEGSVKSTPAKAQWNAQEDSLLRELVKQYGEKNWARIASELHGRAGKQCRDRWMNHLRGDIKKDEWSEEEDRKLIEAHKRLGKKWTAIAREIPGRSENNIKNHWNSTARRKYPNRKNSSVLYKYINSVTYNVSDSISSKTPLESSDSDNIQVFPAFNDLSSSNGAQTIGVDASGQKKWA